MANHSAEIIAAYSERPTIVSLGQPLYGVKLAGKGFPVESLALTYSRACAERLHGELPASFGHNVISTGTVALERIYVTGTDFFDGTYVRLVPKYDVPVIPIVISRKEDLAKDEAMESAERAVAKLKDTGLSDQEIEALITAAKQGTVV